MAENGNGTNIVRDLLLIILVSLVIWYIFRVEKRKLGIGSGSGSGSGNSSSSSTGGGCGACGSDDLAKADYNRQLTVPGGPPLSGTAGFYGGGVSTGIEAQAPTYSGILTTVL
jgi:hypothetical protein